MSAKKNVDKNAQSQTLSKWDLRKSWFRWLLFSHACYNYERLQGSAFAHCMVPIIRKLYTTKEDIKSALKRHMTFFNTEPNIGALIHGIVIAMEEERASGEDISDEAINSIKTGLMGPLAGIGDTIIQGIITATVLAFTVGLGRSGNVMGPILHVLLTGGTIIAINYALWMRGYSFGRQAVEQLLGEGVFDNVIDAAGILGCMVMGALTGNFVSISSPFVIEIGQTQIGLQETLFDAIMPEMLPLLLTLWVYWLLNRGKKPTRIMVYLLVLGVIGSLLGIF